MIWRLVTQENEEIFTYIDEVTIHLSVKFNRVKDYELFLRNGL